MLHVLLGALLIFGLRCIDVPAGTIRVIYMVRGDRMRAFLLSFVESGAYIFAIATVFKDLTQPINMIAYICGYAAGTFIGITVERWIATGWVIVRVMSRTMSRQLAERLRAEQFGVTALHAEGRSGELSVLLVVAPRKRGGQVLTTVQALDPQAFITVDPVSQAIGGFIPRVAAPSAIGK